MVYQGVLKFTPKKQAIQARGIMPNAVRIFKTPNQKYERSQAATAKFAIGPVASIVSHSSSYSGGSSPTASPACVSM
jgi:hypothetical protein